MQIDHKQLLSEVFCEVMEKLAFMFGEFTAKEELSQTTSDCVQARMTFTGALTGALALVVPAEMCVEVAANVLGMEPDDEFVTARATDALKEVLNVTCGRLLTALVGEKPVVDLSVPVATKLDAAGWTAFLNEPEAVGLVVDDKPVLLRLSLEGDGA
jgi:CheY-specific phosphatase CheX